MASWGDAKNTVFMEALTTIATNADPATYKEAKLGVQRAIAGRHSRTMLFDCAEQDIQRSNTGTVCLMLDTVEPKHFKLETNWLEMGV